MSRNKTDVAAAVCAATFIVVLGVSAYWDRSIRALHVFEALPYLAAGILCLRRSKVGYALGAASGAPLLSPDIRGLRAKISRDVQTPVQRVTAHPSFVSYPR